MKRTLIPFLLMLPLLAACGGKTLIDEEHLFERDVWNRFTPEEFEVKVDNIDDYYNIDFTVAVDTALFRYDAVPFMVILSSPGGEERQFYGNVALQEKGRPRGEMQGGYRVATGRIRSYFSFNSQGTHRMAISQATSQYDLEGIHSLTVSVTRAKLDYSL